MTDTDKVAVLYNIYPPPSPVMPGARYNHSSYRDLLKNFRYRELNPGHLGESQVS